MHIKEKTCRLKKVKFFPADNFHLRKVINPYSAEYGAPFVSKLFLSVVPFHCLFRYVFYLELLWYEHILCQFHASPYLLLLYGLQIVDINLLSVGCTVSSADRVVRTTDRVMYTTDRVVRTTDKVNVHNRQSSAYNSDDCNINSVSCTYYFVGCTHYSVDCRCYSVGC